MTLPILHVLHRVVRPPRYLPADVIEAYQNTRCTRHKEHLCNAPFTNMYFNIKGTVGCCWQTVEESFSERWSPRRSIRDIWTGETFQKIRDAIANKNLHTYCKVCEHNIANHRNPLAVNYDNDRPIAEYPTMIELELSNLCNLECIMCHGDLSSLIRKNRERRRPLVSPYNDTFVDQLVEFIPHLYELRINGGESLLHKLAYKVLDKVIEHNPSVHVTMATNGTVFSKAVRSRFEQCNLNFNISIDSLVKDCYEGIRVNAKFEKVMENVERYCELSHKHGRTLCVMVNPMRMNWREMPNFVHFCNDRDILLGFNTIQKPLNLALWNLPKVELQKIYETLSGAQFEIDPEKPRQSLNVRAYKTLVDKQIRSWCDDAGSERLK